MDLLSFHLQLSWSRFGAQVWSPRKDQLAWQVAHIASFERLGGVPATVRVNNEKTAVVRGAGAWGGLYNGLEATREGWVEGRYCAT